MRRMRSPSSAPCVNGELGSIESTATSRSRPRASSTRRPMSVDFPTPGGPVKPTTRRARCADRPRARAPSPRGRRSRRARSPARARACRPRAGARRGRRLCVRGGHGAELYGRSAGDAACRVAHASSLGGDSRTHRCVVQRTARPRRSSRRRGGSASAPRTGAGAARSRARLADRGVAVVEVAVPADPAERAARVVLARLGPAGEPRHVGPRAARARARCPPRGPSGCSPKRLVADGPVALGDPHAVAADQVQHVGEDAAVDARPGLARDRHPAPAAREPPRCRPTRPGGP